MPGYGTASIAGVAQQKDGQDLRALIIGGADLMSARAVNNRPAASGTSLYTQTATLTVGIAFGIMLDFDDIDVLRDTVDEIKEAIDAQNIFNVTYEDDLHNLDTDAVPNGSKWLQYAEGRITGNQVKSVILLFLTR